MSKPIHVLGISGSLRRGSFNTGLLHAAQELLPEGMTLEIFPLHDIPLYNQDDNAEGFPPVVNALREKIAAADALLIATPEYNYSISGVLKNAIDWASRPPAQPFNHKPLALFGAAGSQMGTGRAQYHLRQIAVFLNMHPLNKPEVFVSKAYELFEASGRLTHEPTRQHIRGLLEALAVWTQQLRGE